jgi:endonuclease/exonuclease/phosphatase family metal-dependent hydrolase
VPAREVAYIPSESGWFDGWIVAFETASGPVQVINVHLRPPTDENGSFDQSRILGDYLRTGEDRLREMKRFFGRRQEGLPTVVAGDFNDGEGSLVFEWLKNSGLTNALPQYDQQSPTWRGRLGFAPLSLRLDHVFHSSELKCQSARVIREGPSDHFPVETFFTRDRGAANR